MTTWQEVIRDPLLHNLPFKIELNKYGKILMSPASNLHGWIQGELAFQIRSRKKTGHVITECSIQTADGVKVADVVWASDEFIQQHGFKTPYQKAPELCVEIVSPSNSKAEIEEKVNLYLAKGALEVWVVSEAARIEFYSHTGLVKKSSLVGKVKL